MLFSSGPELFALLAMGHFLGDFGLQNDRMAVEKCPGRDVTLAWQWWLLAHAAIHGFLVALITGLPLLGLAEWVAHALIDLGKGRLLKNLHRLRGERGGGGGGGGGEEPLHGTQ